MTTNTHIKYIGIIPISCFAGTHSSSQPGYDSALLGSTPFQGNQHTKSVPRTISNVLYTDTTLLTLLRCQCNGKSSLSKTIEDRKDPFRGQLPRGWVSRLSNRLKTTSLIYKGLNNPKAQPQPTPYFSPV